MRVRWGGVKEPYGLLRGRYALASTGPIVLELGGRVVCAVLGILVEVDPGNDLVGQRALQYRILCEPAARVQIHDKRSR